MRYYSIVITQANGTPYYFKSTGNAFAPGVTLTSLLPSGPQNPQSGLTNPAALQVELDIAVANVTDPDNKQGAYLRVWGLGLQDLGHASDLNGLDVSVSAGMAKGLPLANPAQAGLLMQGTILQAFGNWVGTDMTLDIVFAAGGSASGTPDVPGNFPFNCPAGTHIAKACAQTLAIGMPNVPASISISPNLTQNYAQTGQYQSFLQFADFIRALSQGIIGDPAYTGVQMTTNGATVQVFDSNGPPLIQGTKAISFQDLIGQPTWISPNVISVKTVLRSDIHVSDLVSLPATPFTQSQAASQRFTNNPQNGLTFSGTFQVTQVHHYGNSRQPDAASWNTTFQMTPNG